MDAVYLVCLLVGGFFVALSTLGGADADGDADFDLDVDADADIDFDLDVDADGADLGHADLGDAAGGAGAGFVDLFSLRFVFLFAAFFGLTGVLLGWAGTVEPLRLALALAMGFVVGLGGNYAIKTFGYRSVSSDVRRTDLIGRTAQVTLPFAGQEKGKISVVAKDTRLYLVARALDSEAAFTAGDEVVVVRLDEGVAEVVRPN